jgi:hypothetical protein
MSFTRYYATDIISDKAGVLQVKSAVASIGVGNNQSVIAAVTGKNIRVVAAILQSASGTIQFKSASGGTMLTAVLSPPLTLVHDTMGWMETTAGQGLFADVVTATVQVTLRYVEVTF